VIPFYGSAVWHPIGTGVLGIPTTLNKESGVIGPGSTKLYPAVVRAGLIGLVLLDNVKLPAEARSCLGLRSFLGLGYPFFEVSAPPRI
jgi:hypothetical protein